MAYFPAILGMVLLHAVFVSAEYAFVKTASSDSLLETKATPQKAYRDIFEDLEGYLLICQVGKSIALLVLGVGLGHSFKKIDFGPLMTNGDLFLIGLGFLSIVLLQTVLGFELPKRLGVSKTDFCVRWLSGFMRIARVVLLPVTYLASQFTQNQNQSLN